MHSEVFGILLLFAHGNDEEWSRRIVMVGYGPQKPFDNACWDYLHTPFESRKSGGNIRITRAFAVWTKKTLSKEHHGDPNGS